MIVASILLIYQRPPTSMSGKGPKDGTLLMGMTIPGHHGDESFRPLR